MSEIITKFEQLANQLQSTDLVTLGLVFVLTGLIAWLGGFGFGKIFAGIIGAVCGGGSAFLIIGKNIQWIGLAAITGAIIFVILAALLTSSFFLARLFSALCSAAAGTLLIFTGMILLLTYKGTKPFEYIYNSQFLTAVLLAMVAFGTVEQMLLCRKSKKESANKKEVNEDKEN